MRWTDAMLFSSSGSLVTLPVSRPFNSPSMRDGLCCHAQYRTHAKEMVDWICDYYAGVEQQPVRSEVDPGYLRPLLPSSAPRQPESFASIMQDVQDKIMPGAWLSLSKIRRSRGLACVE